MSPKKFEACPLVPPTAIPRKHTFREPIEMSARPKRTSRASIAKTLRAFAWCLSRKEPYSALGLQPPLRCGFGRQSGTQEGQQVGIYRICLGGRHAVREALVGL